MADKIEITVLVENTVFDMGLRAEHGLSFLVRAGEGRIVFDTGGSSLFAENARELEVDLARIGSLVLSHNHMDHTGGVEHLVGKRPGLRVYGHPGVFRQHFSRKNGKTRKIGFPRTIDDLQDAGCEVVTNEEPREIAPGLWLTGYVPRESDFETVGDRFFLDEALTRPDDIADDQSLVVVGDDALLLVLGCCHSGIVNTVRYVSSLFPGKGLAGIIGGMHLNDAGQSRIAKTLSELKTASPDKIVPGHCTGFEAVFALRQAFGSRFVPLSTGQTFTFEI